MIVGDHLKARGLLKLLGRSDLAYSASPGFKRRLALKLGTVWQDAYPSPPPLILFRGDSTSAGTYISAGVTHTDGRKNSLVSQLAKIFTANGFPAQHESFLSGRVGAVMADFTAYDPRVTIGAGWTAAYDPVGGQRFGNSTTTNPIAFTPVAPFDNFTVLYPAAPGQGTSTVNIDGGASLGTINANVTAALGKTTYTVALGVHTINFARATGSSSLIGVLPWNSAERKTLLVNAAAGGEQVANAVSDPYAWANLRGAIALAPVLTVISYGINDLIAGRTVAAIGADLQTLITTGKTTGEVVLLSIPPQNLGVPATSAALVAALEAEYARLATVNDCGLVITRRVFLDSATAYAEGLMGSDQVHPTQVGTAVWGRAISAALRSWVSSGL